MLDSCLSWCNDNQNKCFRIKEVATKRIRKVERRIWARSQYHTNTFVKISRRTACFHDEEFQSYFVSDAISRLPSRGIIRVLPPSSLTRGKGLNNVARHKGQVSCAARHSWHFREKRTESPQHFLLVPIAVSSGVHVVRENLPRRFNFVYLGMLPKKKEDWRSTERGKKIVAQRL